MIHRFGLMGLSLKDANKGCEALTFTFLKILLNIYKKEELEIICITKRDQLGLIRKNFPELNIRCSIFNIYSIKSWISTYNVICTCDAVFDGSYGDGFTGIYGFQRNVVQIMRKQIVYWAHRPLFLLPQTYGHYKPLLVNWSEWIINNSALAYARDDTAKLIKGNHVKTTADMAFLLPYEKNKFEISHSYVNIGINVSSLLWDKNTNKQFGLTVDYQKFYYDLISYLVGIGGCHIHLIAHVVDKDHFEAPENDYRICCELKEKYGNDVVLAPAFEDAISAKSYIANMDFFLGSRMHSTIAAFSSRVVTIPFSYCHKFEALYFNLQYPYVIPATKKTTDEALSMFKEWFNNPQPLKDQAAKSLSLALKRLDSFQLNLREVLVAQKLL